MRHPQPTMFTTYHSKVCAHQLTLRFPTDSPERLAGAVAGAQVELHPHQVEAALFGFRSPLSKGAILADECGLGKTIEAGLVVSQRWAEDRRRILIITPASLRQQWRMELVEKFFLPCRIMEAGTYNQAMQDGARPFDCREAITICSLQFAAQKCRDLKTINWDLVVIDEAHRLRNVYRSGSIVANQLKRSLQDRPKLLLTATPMQNSLLELYGLASVLDDDAFGSLKCFRAQYLSPDPKRQEQLKRRLSRICHRTLRRQVTHYVPFTERKPLLEKFTPEESEDRLYDEVSAFLRRDLIHSIPIRQSPLMTLMLRKLLASSSFAVAKTLAALADRLRAQLAGAQAAISLPELLRSDCEGIDEIVEDWGEYEAEAGNGDPLNQIAAADELAELDRLAALAESIPHNAKGKALRRVLETAFVEVGRLGAARKALIFTESRRTQDYLLRLLEDGPWKDTVVLFNGSNTDPRSQQIYADWLERNRGTDRISGSASADRRSAIVDYFRNTATIMVATEAAAEGCNLQFCSLVVNYDLPWNPQRIEQRIGRCHRYGQACDVVVVNFLNTKNAADLRVYELLAGKLRLFEGVFGASDEVLGALESGVDIERRIAEIYRACRSPDEIAKAFDRLQADLRGKIDAEMRHTHLRLVENFDEAVLHRVRNLAPGFRTRFERELMTVAQVELKDCADFDSESGFCLRQSPFAGDIPLGKYQFPRRGPEAHLLHTNAPLVVAMLRSARERALPFAHLRFEWDPARELPGKLGSYRGQSGLLSLQRLVVEVFGEREEHLLMAAVNDAGDTLPTAAAEELFLLPAKVSTGSPPGDSDTRLAKRELRLRQQTLQKAKGRQAAILRTEEARLRDWAADLKAGVSSEIREINRKIKEARRRVAAERTMQEQLAANSTLKKLEAERARKQQAITKAKRNIERRRRKLVAAVREKWNPATTFELLFSVRWSLASGSM